MEKREIDYAQCLNLLEQLCEMFGGRFVPVELNAPKIEERDYNSIRKFVKQRLSSDRDFELFWESSSWQERADLLSKMLNIYVDKNSLLQNFLRHF